MALIGINTRVNIFSRLAKMFRFRQQFDLLFGNTISMVLDVNRLLRVPYLPKKTSVSVTATGTKVVYTVPKGRRVCIKDMRVAKSSGTFTFNGFWIYNDSDYQCQIDQFTAVSDRWSDFPEQVWLEEDWSIAMNVDSLSGAGAVDVYIYGEEEEVY